MQIDTQSIFQNKSIAIVAQAAEELRIPAFAVGGYVRDIILGRPSKDIDILCVGPDSSRLLAEKVREKLGKGTNLAVFRNFGTAQVKRGKVELEFVTARRESYTRDTRNPQCQPGTLLDDLSRRDFTINAMCVRLVDRDLIPQNEYTSEAELGLSGEKGELIDLFDGMIDLTQCILRTPLEPQITFSDDPLRMMRCVRFASQLTDDEHPFAIDTDTYSAICEQANRLEIITHERIKDEFVKIINSRRPSVGLQLMQQTGLMKIALPDVDKLSGVERRGTVAHKDNFRHTMQVLDTVAENSSDTFVRLAALFHDIGKPQSKEWDDQRGWTFHGHEWIGHKMIPRIFRNLTLPLGSEMEKVKKLVVLHMRPISLIEDTITDSAIRRLLFEAGDDFDDLMILCDADITSNNELKRRKFHDNYIRLREKIKEIEEKDHIRNFQPPVSGDEIMQTFHLTPCRQVGQIKDAIKDAILDGNIPNERESAVKLMYELAEKFGITTQ